MAVKSPMSVVIVGGSLAGLFAGIVFLRLGHNVTILERASVAILEDQGAGIMIAPIFPKVNDFLRKLGHSLNPILDFMKKFDRTDVPFFRLDPEISIKFIKKDGSLIFKSIIKDEITGPTNWDLMFNILRANFDGKAEGGYIESAKKEDSDGTAKYCYNSHVQNLRNLGSTGVEVEYMDADGKQAKITADLVIGADGASSMVRTLVQPEVTRDYAGYVAWRGTVKQQDKLSKTTKEALQSTGTCFLCKGNQAVLYLIPGYKGSMEPEDQHYNLVWYSNYTADSQAHQDLFTDTSGVRRQFTVPQGKLRPEVIAAQREKAASMLPAPHSEVFQNIENPFIQAITDVVATKGVFMDGKVLLVGDAMAGIRPQAVAASIQAALHALLLHDTFCDEPSLSLEEWEEKALGWSKETQQFGVLSGQLAQFGKHPMADD